MGRSMHRLSAIKVAKLAAKGMHLDGAGLYLNVSATGTKSWVFRYRRRDMGLGPFPAVSLADARQKAEEARKLLARGEDPIEVRKQQDAPSALMTFDQAAAEYIKSHKAAWSGPRTASMWRATLAAYASPVIGGLPVAAISTEHVLELLQPIWTAKPETGSQVRQRVEAVLDWAKAKRLREGENPAVWRNHLAKLLPPQSKVRKVQHHPSLPYAELPAFMVELRADSSLSARLCEFQILTAARPTEARLAAWAEIDLDAATWSLPGARMKTREAHRVPLSKAAVAMLAELPRMGPLLFPGQRTGRPMADTVLRDLFRKMERPGFTAHGFRSSFRDWAAEETNFPNMVVEMALAHTVGSDTERAYRRGELLAKRAKLMEAWANFCGRPAEKANVIPMAKIKLALR